MKYFIQIMSNFGFGSFPDFKLLFKILIVVFFKFKLNSKYQNIVCHIAGATPACVHWHVFARSPHKSGGLNHFFTIVCSFGRPSLPRVHWGVPLFGTSCQRAEDTTNEVVSHVSGRQQHIREAASERPRRQFIQVCNNTYLYASKYMWPVNRVFLIAHHN